MINTDQHINILFFDDNEGDYDLVKKCLDKKFKSTSLIHCKSHEEADELLNSGQRFEIIILDLTFSYDSEGPMINRMMDIAGDVPVIILTKSPNLDFCIDSLKLGVSDYIFKDDLNSNVLFKSINYTIEKHKHLSVIAESEKKYSNIFHFSPIPMFVYDIETLAFLDVNSAAIKKYGYSLAEFQNMTIHRISSNKDSEQFDESLESIKNKTSFKFNQYFHHQKKNGELIKVEVTVRAIDFQGRKAKVAIANDVTEKILHYETLKTQNERLKEIAWIQSHEMRSPASKILGIVELLETKSCSKKEQDLLINSIKTTMQDLDGVIRSISKKTE